MALVTVRICDFDDLEATTTARVTFSNANGTRQSRDVDLCREHAGEWKTLGRKATRGRRKRTTEENGS
jgi:hypothetical protein